MKKNNRKSLSLSKQTLVHLTRNELVPVQGGKQVVSTMTELTQTSCRPPTV